MGIRVEQLDVQSVAKIFVTKRDLQDSVIVELDRSIKAGDGINIATTDDGDTGTTQRIISLKEASDSELGGIKLGTGLTKGDGGVVNVSIEAKKPTAGEGIEIQDLEGNAQISVRPASNSQLGAVKVGKGLSIDPESHVLSANVGNIATDITPQIGGDNIVQEGGKLHGVAYTSGNGIEVKAGGNNKTKVIDLKVSNKSQLGGVIIGDGINVDDTGKISVPTIGVATTGRTGVVKVGSNLSVTGDGTLSADIGISDITELQEQIDVIVAQQQLIVDELDRIYDIIGGGSTSGANGIKVYGKNFIAGTSIVEKTGTKVKFPDALSNTDYKVALTLSTNTNGSLGEIWVDSKENDGFTVKSTGSLLRAQIDWVVFQAESGTTEFNESSFPFAKGSLTLTSTTGVDTTLTPGYNSTDYGVFITPTTNNEGTYGEVWVEGKENAKFVTKSTGSTTGTVDYITVKYGKEAYNQQNYPIIGGHDVFDTEKVITIEDMRSNSNYQVIIMPENEQGGLLGEYWVTDKKPNQFTVKTTGGTKAKFNYMIIGH